MLSLEQVLTDDNRQEIPFPPPCPVEAVEGVKEGEGQSLRWFIQVMDSALTTAP